MPSASLDRLPVAAEALPAAPLVGGSDGSAEAAGLPPKFDGPTFALAHRAVVAVREAVGHFAGRTRGSLQLQLSVGAEELIVHVQRQADGFHASFRTDSAELRAALAQEWQATIPATPDRHARFAAPEFCDRQGFSPDASSDHSSSRHRPESPEPEYNGARSGGVAPAAATGPARAAAPVRAATSLHLHTLA